jgi:hypothetical protein
MDEQPEITRNHHTGLGLHPKQTAAITLLVQGRSYTATADAVGIERKALWQWRQDPVFRAALSAELATIREAARGRMAALADDAIDALRDIVANGETDAVRIAAVKLIFERISMDSSAAAENMADNGRKLVPVDRLDTIPQDLYLALRAANVMLVDAKAASRELGRRMAERA